jgi:hypothetical protein
MDTSSIVSSEEGWQTVTRNKKTAVPTASGGYIPPHLRVKSAEGTPKAPKIVNVTSMEDFPSLGGSAQKSGGSAWGSKASFTQKIHELIATEQRTEAEKMEAEEAARELEGYAVLSLKFDKERYIAFNEKMATAERGLERFAAAYDREMYAYLQRKEEDDDMVSVASSTDYED